MTKELSPHPHREVIKAWVKGAAIQFDSLGEWVDDKNPQWYVDVKYRLKPPMYRFRPYLYQTHSIPGPRVSAVDSEEMGAEVEKAATFLSWLGPWQEVEV